MIMDSEGLFLWHFVENKEMHGIKSSNAISYFTTWLPKEKTILCRQIAIETLKCFCCCCCSQHTVYIARK